MISLRRVRSHEASRRRNGTNLAWDLDRRPRNVFFGRDCSWRGDAGYFPPVAGGPERHPKSPSMKSNRPIRYYDREGRAVVRKSDIPASKTIAKAPRWSNWASACRERVLPCRVASRNGSVTWLECQGRSERHPSTTFRTSQRVSNAKTCREFRCFFIQFEFAASRETSDSVSSSSDTRDRPHLEILASGPHNSLLCRMVGSALNCRDDHSRCESRTMVPLRGNPAAVRIGLVDPGEQSLCDPLAKLCYVTQPNGVVNAECIVGRVSRPVRPLPIEIG